MKTNNTLIINPMQPSELSLQHDPFDSVYATLSEEQRQLLDAGETAILEQKLIELKALAGGQAALNISLGLDFISQSHQVGTRNRHRLNRLNKNLDRIEDVATEAIIGLINQQPRALDDPRKSRIRETWNQLIGNRESSDYE